MSDYTGLYDVLVLGVATGAISMLITKASIFNKAHEWLEKCSPFLDEMLSCPWCTSHWVALFFTLVYRPRLINPVWLPVDWLVTLMAMVFVAAVTARIIYSSYRPLMGQSNDDKEAADLP
jgi:hypothetical protein